MRRFFLWGISAVLVTTFPLPRSVAQAREIPVDGYAAVVNNDRVITVGEILEAMEPVRRQLELMYEGEDLEMRLQDAYRSTLQALIERALIVEEFKARGGSIPDRIVDDYINQIISERFTNRVALLHMLQEQRMTWEDWRNNIRDRLVIQQMRQQEVTRRVVITPRQVREAYEQMLDRYRTPEQVSVRVIGIQRGTTPEETQVKREQAEKIRSRAVAGEDFAALARSESEGPKAADGGDMGWLEPEALAPELAQAVKTLESGQISPVIEGESMFFIIKLEGRRHASVTPFEEVRSRIEEELRKQEEERLYRTWMEQLRGKHYVQIFRERIFE